jgi:hypothetical protein
MFLCWLLNGLAAQHSFRVDDGGDDKVDSAVERLLVSGTYQTILTWLT